MDRPEKGSEEARDPSSSRSTDLRGALLSDCGCSATCMGCEMSLNCDVQRSCADGAGEAAGTCCGAFAASKGFSVGAGSRLGVDSSDMSMIRAERLEHNYNHNCVRQKLSKRSVLRKICSTKICLFHIQVASILILFSENVSSNLMISVRLMSTHQERVFFG